MSRSSICIAMALAITGCYSAAYSTPKLEMPTLVDHEPVDLDIKTVRYWSDSRLRYLSGDVVHRMSYNGQKLSYGQVRLLADPTYRGKLADYDKLVQACSGANVPRYIGYGSTLLGVLAYTGGGAVFQDNGNLQMGVGFGLLGVGVLAYATGYFLFGGSQCHEAEGRAHELHLGNANDTELSSDATIDELATIVKDFNRRVLDQQASE